MHSAQRAGGVLAVTIVLLLGVAACGSDSGTSEASPTTKQSVQKDGAAKTPAAEKDEPVSDSPSSDGSDSKFCKTIRKYNDEDEGDPFDLDMTTEKGAAKFKPAMNEIVASAPAELKGPLNNLVGAMDTLSKVDMSDPESAQKASEAVDQDKLEADSDKINDYLEKVCGIED